MLKDQVNQKISSKNKADKTDLQVKRLTTQISWIQYIFIVAIQVMEFQVWGTKLERILLKNQHTQRKLLNFENWCSGAQYAKAGSE